MAIVVGRNCDKYQMGKDWGKWKLKNKILNWRKNQNEWKIEDWLMSIIFSTMTRGPWGTLSDRPAHFNSVIFNQNYYK